MLNKQLYGLRLNQGSGKESAVLACIGNAMSIRIKATLIIIAATLALLFSTSAAAEDSTWKHSASVYLWGSGLNGSVGMGKIDADVDASFSDILDKLDIAFMGKYRAKKDVWSINADMMYVGLEGSGDIGPTSGSATLDQTMFSLFGGYEVQPGLDIIAGLRYMNIDVAMNIGPVNRSRSESWVDPIVGAEYRAPVSEKWSFYGFGDIGGFGVGSDLSWQLGAYFNYQINDTWSTCLGYRILDIDYEDGNRGDSNRFKYEVRQSGPMLGITAQF